MSRLLAVLLSLVTVAALAGCASSGTAGGRGTGSPAGRSTSPSSAARPMVLHASEASDGKTITLHQGDTLLLQLHSTYWKVSPPVGNVLHQIGKPSYGSKSVEARDCVPGAGCGMLEVKFQAEHAGRAEVHASRTTCGEALRCSPSSGSYRLTVVVQ